MMLSVVVAWMLFGCFLSVLLFAVTLQAALRG